jgi:hypothetical protein
MSLFFLGKISPKRSDFSVANSAEARGRKRRKSPYSDI